MHLIVNKIRLPGLDHILSLRLFYILHYPSKAFACKSMFTHRNGSKVIKLLSCSTQLSMKLTMPINAKMPKIVGY